MQREARKNWNVRKCKKGTNADKRGEKEIKTIIKRQSDKLRRNGQMAPRTSLTQAEKELKELV